VFGKDGAPEGKFEAGDRFGMAEASEIKDGESERVVALHLVPMQIAI
jgi:hypothetical protein